MELLHVPEEKITVIYHGITPKAKYTLDRPIIEGKYILYVGERGYYKSFLPMVRHLRPFIRNHTDIKLVCTGAPFTRSETRELTKLGLLESTIYIHADDKEMFNLYANAMCFIYPSVYEGFGMPILEAYSADCPVLLNRKSCFPEIAGDAALYFELDYSTSDLEQVMEGFSQFTDNDKSTLIEKQRQRLRLFSWEKAAKEFAEVYSKVIDKS